MSDRWSLALLRTHSLDLTERAIAVGRLSAESPQGSVGSRSEITSRSGAQRLGLGLLESWSAHCLADRFGSSVEAVFDGVPHEVTAAAEVQLAEDVADMVLSGLG